MASKSKGKAPSDGLTRVDPSWSESDEGDGPLTELLAGNQGALSPFGDDLTFPLPSSSLHYEHPTALPNHAG